MSPREAPPLIAPAARILRIVLWGAMAAVVVFGLTVMAEWLIVGRTNDIAVARLETRSRQALDIRTEQLAAAASTLADAVREAPAYAATDPAFRARLFAAAADAVTGHADTAVTAYDASGRPLAWVGRPSEHPPANLAGPAWAVDRTPLGPRLRLLQRLRADDDAARVGTVVAEQPLIGPEMPGPAIDASILVGADPDVPVEFSAASERPGAEPTQGFRLDAPDGTPLLVGTISSDRLAATRARWRASALLLAAAAWSLGLLLAASVILGWRTTRDDYSGYLGGTLVVLLLVLTARLGLVIARPTAWGDTALFGGAVYNSPAAGPFLASPMDLLLSGLTVAAVGALLLSSVAAWRRARRQARRPVKGAAWLPFLAMQVGAGAALAAILATEHWLLDDTVRRASTDLLRFSLHPWDPVRITLQIGLILWHAAGAAIAVAILRASLLPWRLGRGVDPATAGAIAAWVALPLAAGQATIPALGLVWLPMLVFVAVAACTASRFAARYRCGSHSQRLGFLLTLVVLPAVLAYPVVARAVADARVTLVAERYAPEALAQRQSVQDLLADALDEIDRLPGLPDVFNRDAAGSVDAAFDIWRQTRLAASPITSSVELHDAAGVLVDRYAFNLSDDVVTPPTWSEGSCDWAIFEEVSPFFAVERLMLHAGRAVCRQDGTRTGSLVVHAVLDYENLPFIASPNPYLDLVGVADPLVGEGRPAEGLEYAVYGWSRTPLYASAGRAWSLPDDVFALVEASRDPVRARIARNGQQYDAVLISDRFGIYALGLPVPALLDHLVNLAELAVLGVLVFLTLLAAAVAGRRATGGRLAGRALILEVRASFYRKLFLAFVAATVVPVLILAVVTRVYIAAQLRAGVEQDALSTAAAARRIVEDLAAPRAAQQGVEVDDNLLVWVSRLIDQDVNLFGGDTLIATSERNLFAGGLLPTRTPAALYQSVLLAREGATVSRDRIGTQNYLVAATPLADLPLDAILTVPLASQQQAIEGQIDTLDRRVLLAVLVLIFGSSGIGYSMAERIADPVNRLTRATRRIALGDLDARITPTSSDELRRLVQDFNQMASELQRQRGELERHYRLAAWAEMASQVAHEIKNPLTPIQLHAEHLRRVHADRGTPLGPVVTESTDTILDQVRLLRRIASDFSTFASSPTARPARVDIGDLLDEVLGPYRRVLPDRLQLRTHVPDGMPDVFVDRTLVGRALTNLIENATHAMPGAGTLTVRAVPELQMVRIDVTDSGMGMDGEGLARAFEPSFSTKMTGTGLGLPIARRNVELCGGMITIASEAGTGTIVTVRLPTTASAGVDVAGR